MSEAGLTGESGREYKLAYFLDLEGYGDRLIVTTEKGKKSTYLLKKLRDEGQELDFLSRLNHPGIAKYTDEIFAKEGGKLARYMVFPFDADDVSLDAEMDNSPKKPEEVSNLIYRIAEPLVHMHDEGIVHTDIKGGNIVRKKNGDLIIIDFEGAQDLKGKIQNPRRTYSPGYFAPELYMRGGVTPKTDTYSLGMLGFNLKRGRPIKGVKRKLLDQQLKVAGSFDRFAKLCGRNERAMRQLGFVTPTKVKRDFEKAPKRLREIIASCVELDPHNRPTATDIRRALKR